MKPPTKPGWSLSDADRERLRSILGSISEDATETSPEFIRLLEAWEAVKAPWNLVPTVPAYHCKGGEWVSGGVGAVVTAIAAHLGDIA